MHASVLFRFNWLTKGEFAWKCKSNSRIPKKTGLNLRRKFCFEDVFNFVTQMFFFQTDVQNAISQQQPPTLISSQLHFHCTCSNKWHLILKLLILFTRSSLCLCRCNNVGFVVPSSLLNSGPSFPSAFACKNRSPHKSQCWVTKKIWKCVQLHAIVCDSIDCTQLHFYFQLQPDQSMHMHCCTIQVMHHLGVILIVGPLADWSHKHSISHRFLIGWHTCSTMQTLMNVHKCIKITKTLQVLEHEMTICFSCEVFTPQKLPFLLAPSKTQIAHHNESCCNNTNFCQTHNNDHLFDPVQTILIQQLSLSPLDSLLGLWSHGDRNMRIHCISCERQNRHHGVVLEWRCERLLDRSTRFDALHCLSFTLIHPTMQAISGVNCGRRVKVRWQDWIIVERIDWAVSFTASHAAIQIWILCCPQLQLVSTDFIVVDKMLRMSAWWCCKCPVLHTLPCFHHSLHWKTSRVHGNIFFAILHLTLLCCLDDLCNFVQQSLQLSMKIASTHHTLQVCWCFFLFQHTLASWLERTLLHTSGLVWSSHNGCQCGVHQNSQMSLGCPGTILQWTRVLLWATRISGCEFGSFLAWWHIGWNPWWQWCHLSWVSWVAVDAWTPLPDTPKAGLLPLQSRSCKRWVGKDNNSIEMFEDTWFLCQQFCEHWALLSSVCQSTRKLKMRKMLVRGSGPHFLCSIIIPEFWCVSFWVIIILW